jgi:hypothetical protein
MASKKINEVVVFDTHSVVLGPWTVVEVRNDKGVCGYGASHKSKLDKWNPDLGYNIALGRAKKDI